MSTPNMGLTQSTPLITGGPAWAVNIEADLVLIDQHDHSAGKGVPIPISSLNVNGDLSMSGFSVTNLLTSDYNSQPATLIATSAVYVVNGDLYYNNGSGIPIRITAGIAVNVAGVGGITGLAGTLGAVTYSNLTKTFTFTQDANKTANIIAGTLTLSEPGVVGPSLINLKSPAALAGSYDITLPTALPVTTKYLQLTPAGQLISDNELDNVTLEEVGGLIRIKNSGVTNAKLANMPAGSVKANVTLVSGPATDVTPASNGLVLIGVGGGLNFGTLVPASFSVDSVATVAIQAGAVTLGKLAAEIGVQSPTTSGFRSNAAGTPGANDTTCPSITIDGSKRTHCIIIPGGASESILVRGVVPGSAAGDRTATVGFYIDGVVQRFSSVFYTSPAGLANFGPPINAFSIDFDPGTIPSGGRLFGLRFTATGATAAISWNNVALRVYQS
jgi:hypothetical protein